MTLTPKSIASKSPTLIAAALFLCSALIPATGISCLAQQTPPPSAAQPAAEKPLPGLDLPSIDLAAAPCVDMYKFACGKFSANHPIPADQPGVDPFYVLYNVNTQELNRSEEHTSELQSR